jgi:hypothetical protein
MASPGFRFSSLASEAFWAPVVVTQTSPVDLLTDQVPPSAARALEPAPKTSAAVTMHRKASTLRMMVSSVRTKLIAEDYRKCFKIGLVHAACSQAAINRSFTIKNYEKSWG